jgi:hypothetical protein
MRQAMAARILSARILAAIAGLAALSVVGTAWPVVAQNPTPTGAGPSVSGARPSAHPRIDVNPRRLLYRTCASRYVLQYRPSGTVLFPEKHCWWVRG